MDDRHSARPSRTFLTGVGFVSFVLASAMLLAGGASAKDIEWRFPTDKITLEQWTEFREEVLSKPDIQRQEFANQLVIPCSPSARSTFSSSQSTQRTRQWSCDQ